MRLSGRFRSSLIIGLQGIRARKMRTLLSMISLFLGVLAVVIVQAASVSAEKAVLQDVELTQGIDGTSVMYMSVTNKSVPVVLDTLKDQPRAIATSSVQATIGEPASPGEPGRRPLRRRERAVRRVRADAGAGGLRLERPLLQGDGREPGRGPAARAGDRAEPDRDDRGHPAVPTVPPAGWGVARLCLGTVALAPGS